jgi:hypothetical protein
VEIIFEISPKNHQMWLLCGFAMYSTTTKTELASFSRFVIFLNNNNINAVSIKYLHRFSWGSSYGILQHKQHANYINMIPFTLLANATTA